MTDKLREALEQIDRAIPKHYKDCFGIREIARTALAAAPQPAPVDREALVEVIRSVVPLSVKHLRTLADALLARGLRLPAPETMAWAVVGEDGKVVPASCGFDKEYVAGRVAHPWDRIVRVAIREVEGGDDA